MKRLIEMFFKTVAIVAGLPIRLVKYLYAWFFRRHVAVRMLLVVFLLLGLSLLVALVSIFHLFRQNGLPFRKIQVSELYKPSFWHDKEALRRVLHGRFSASDSEPEVEIDLEEEKLDETLPAAVLRYEKMARFRRKIVDIGWSKDDKFWWNFAGMTEEQKNGLEYGLEELKKITWQEIAEAGRSSKPLSVNLEDFSKYLVFKKTQDRNFDVTEYFAGILRHGALVTAANPYELWGENSALNVTYKSMHDLCSLNLLSADEAKRLYDVVAEVEKTKRDSDSDAVLKRALDHAKADMLYLYRLSPLGAYLLCKAYADPLETVKQEVEVVTLPATAENMQKLDQIPLSCLDIFRGNQKKTYLAGYARLTCDCKMQRAIVMQTLLYQSGSQETITDIYTGKPLLSMLFESNKVFYSAGPNQLDDQMKGDDFSLIQEQKK